METQALFFTLGMLLIIFIAVTVITVFSFVKVLKLQNRVKDEFNGLWQQTSQIEDNFYRNESQQSQDLYKEINDTRAQLDDIRAQLDRDREVLDTQLKEVYSYVDSRLDKSLNSIKSKSIITD